MQKNIYLVIGCYLNIKETLCDLKWSLRSNIQRVYSEIELY